MVIIQWIYLCGIVIYMIILILAFQEFKDKVDKRHNGEYKPLHKKILICIVYTIAWPIIIVMMMIIRFKHVKQIQKEMSE